MNYKKLIKIVDSVNDFRDLYIAEKEGDTATANRLRMKYKKSHWDKEDIDKAVLKAKNQVEESIEAKKQQALEKKQQALEKRKAAWNKARYNKWIKEQAGNGGWEHAYDMAQNANYEKGLIEYVERMEEREGTYNEALDRIQWDIEAQEE